MSAAPRTYQSCLRRARHRPWTRCVRAVSTASKAILPALLERAKRMRAEHERLEKILAKGFDSSVAKRAGELAPIATLMRKWDSMQNAREDLVAMQNDPQLKDLAEAEISGHEASVAELGHELSVALSPKHPFADMPCLIEIKPGPGGQEGRLFATTLVQMYTRYCQNKGYRIQVVKHETASGELGDDYEAPLQEAVLEIKEAGAYGVFRGESGMHRVQRVPATERSGRTHTSAVAVWVLPSFSEHGTENARFDDPESDFYIDPSEVRVEAMRARGAGGQHVNKIESAIRLTHIPTGTVVSMQDHRSQHQNRESAWRLMRSRIGQVRREAREEAAKNLKNSALPYTQTTRGDKVRTYNYGQNRCTDHRSGLDVFNIPDIIDGGEAFDKIIESVQAWNTEQEIKKFMAEEDVAGRVENGADKGAKTGLAKATK